MCKVPAVHVAEKRVWTWWHIKNLSTSAYCSLTALYYCKTRCMTGSYCHIMRSLSLAICCSSCLLYHSPLFSWHQCPQQNNCADCGTGRQLTKEGNTHTRTNTHTDKCIDESRMTSLCSISSLLCFTHWFWQNDASVCRLTNPLAQPCMNSCPRSLIHYACDSVCECTCV